MTQREAYNYFYRIRPTLDGRVELDVRHGGDAWEMGTIEGALAEMLDIERELGAEWMVKTEKVKVTPTR